jgi:hypothetical protein
MVVYRYNVGQQTSGDKWLLTGKDGCRDSYEVTFCAPFDAVVEIRSKMDYNASNDVYGCSFGTVVGNQAFLQTAYINGVCVEFCSFGSGLAGVSLTKIGKCGCKSDECKVDCANSPDGFCCIPHSLTNALLNILSG